MLTHLLISLLGAGIFLRIVAKEKNRRYRHLLHRVEEIKQRQAEEQQQQLAFAEAAAAGAAVADAEPIPTIDPIGQAA